MARKSRFSESLKSPFQWIVTCVVLLFLAIVFGAPIFDRGTIPTPPGLDNAHAIYVAMFQYSVDHNEAYPEGSSSTEVFQKLIDGGYTDDPSIFYVDKFEMHGKAKATSKKLKPENVCFDVTAPLSSHSSDYLPLLFLTGYRIEYRSGGNAVPLSSEFKPLGVPVVYQSGMSVLRRLSPGANGAVTNFIDPDFVPDGVKYRQLTPAGPLPSQ